MATWQSLITSAGEKSFHSPIIILVHWRNIVWFRGFMQLISSLRRRARKRFLYYLHWMSNFQPSSSASEGDMWLYALHDKYFPASERLKVIDNVLVVWLPSLDVCKEIIQFCFYSLHFLAFISEWIFHLDERETWRTDWKAERVKKNYFV